MRQRSPCIPRCRLFARFGMQSYRGMNRDAGHCPPLAERPNPLPWFRRYYAAGRVFMPSAAYIVSVPVKVEHDALARGHCVNDVVHDLAVMNESFAAHPGQCVTDADSQSTSELESDRRANQNQALPRRNTRRTRIPWTAEEDALVLTLQPTEVERRTKRTIGSNGEFSALRPSIDGSRPSTGRSAIRPGGRRPKIESFARRPRKRPSDCCRYGRC